MADISIRAHISFVTNSIFGSCWGPSDVPDMLSKLAQIPLSGAEERFTQSAVCGPNVGAGPL